MKTEELPERLRLAVKRWERRVEFGWEPSSDGTLSFETDLVELARALLKELGLPAEPHVVKRSRPH